VRQRLGDVRRLVGSARDLQLQLARRPAAEPEQPGRGEVGVVDQNARPEREGADVAAGLAIDDPANGERLRPDLQRVADLKLQLRQQLRAHEHTVVTKEACEYWPCCSVNVP
jgi:hypothetical protein